MPTYDYICDSCEHAWELFQKITDDPVKNCPECGKKKAVRQFGTGAAIMFKGSGFYETDYRSDSYKKSAEAEKAKKSDAKDSKKAKDSSSNGSAGGESSGSATTTSDSAPKSDSKPTSANKKKKKD